MLTGKGARMVNTMKGRWWSVLVALGLLVGIGLWYGRETPPPTMDRTESATGTLYFRASTAAGLTVGERIMVEERMVGRVAAVDLVAGGVVVTCSMDDWPNLFQPVHAVIRRVMETGKRYVLLKGNEMGEEKLQPGDVIEGVSEVPPPVSSLAPMWVQ